MMMKYPAPDLFLASVRRVVDGDTISATLDLGFRVAFTVNIRILGLAAPEIKDTNGPVCARVLAAHLPAGLQVLVQSAQKRSFERYVGRVLVRARSIPGHVSEDLPAADFNAGYPEPYLVGADGFPLWDVAAVLITRYRSLGFASAGGRSLGADVPGSP